MLGVFLNRRTVLGPLPSVPELLMTSEFSFTAAAEDQLAVMPTPRRVGNAQERRMLLAWQQMCMP